MTKLPSPSVAVSLAVAVISVVFSIADALGSGATLAVTHSGAVCGVVASRPTQSIVCHRRSQNVDVLPNVSYSSISGGRTTLCGLRTGGDSLFCWGNLLSENATAVTESRRVYFNTTVVLENLAVGDHHICATVASNGTVKCWRYDHSFRLPSGSDRFASISSGSGFSCGILKENSRVRCWGSGSSPSRIENRFGNMSMTSIFAGGSHVCGVNTTGFLVCEGNNDSGQLNTPIGSEAFEYSQLSLGANHSCAIRASNNTVVCWGGGGRFSVNDTNGVSFELIVSSLDFTCGLTTANFSVVCWGPGWSNITNNSSSSSSFSVVPLPEILPGPCVSSTCNCSTYPLSQKLCSGKGNICKPCLPQISSPPPTPQQPLPPSPSISPPSSSSPSGALTRGLLAFAIVGSVGAFAGICTVVYCLWTGVCFGHKKIHNSVQPTITREASSNGGGGGTSNNSPPSRSSTIRRQGSRIMRRQRSGTSSKHADRAEEFSFAELAAATINFSPENKLGAGSFGVVYRGKLTDGREVAIKRSETAQLARKYQEKESAFESELSFLSRLHHKHLVRLVGFCEEKEERLLVYEYMKNGALYDHLHDKNNVEKRSSVLNSWKIRIKIALDAARGIEYLHNYAVPPIIHRDIKSSNILLDANWTAKVSDFGLSLMGPESGRDYRPTKAAGTVGYIDPEYYGLNVLTAKSDVYGLGVVLLELLTGKRAIFKNGEDGGTPISVVDFAVPAIMAGELAKVLDQRVGPPELNEGEAVELVAYTAMHCVNLEGKERPTMTDIVANLERALSLCDDSHGSISSGVISIVSE
ncbi:Putative serine/threonine-protein kinase-like protein [Morus notabilis]|uniref:non-specific serine/threonine protein kinase n=1 Tax=Morus notabilis TaxID=981085 RepID=W9RFJ3_9ROSA|nr:putative serine/threonine-protein kinase-like protein CCR3 [Morus notabilis]EXB88391.1 Putative serine/threonine-protein kinase-like protein [Morus notabilis]